MSGSEASQTVDLRSDAVTLPTGEMLDAMRSDTYEWSTSRSRIVIELEEVAAERLGKEAAVFVPTGTMANTLALLCWGRPGDQFVAEDSSHVVVSEDHAFARLAGMYPRRLTGVRGHLQPQQVERVFTECRMSHTETTSIVWTENTHNFAGGTVAPREILHAVGELARRKGARMHLDGARLFNAAAAEGVHVEKIAAAADSVTVNLNKALSAPGGALLCGPSEFAKEARARAKGLGGVMGQGGMLAAAGLVALREMTGRVRDDHLTARSILDGLRGIAGLVLPGSVDTNIVMVGLEDGLTAPAMLSALASRGVLALAFDQSTLRLVTHRHIGAVEVARAIDAFAMASKVSRRERAGLDVPGGSRCAAAWSGAPVEEEVQ